MDATPLVHTAFENSFCLLIAGVSPILSQCPSCRWGGVLVQRAVKEGGRANGGFQERRYHHAVHGQLRELCELKECVVLGWLIVVKSMLFHTSPNVGKKKNLFVNRSEKCETTC